MSFYMYLYLYSAPNICTCIQIYSHLNPQFIFKQTITMPQLKIMNKNRSRNASSVCVNSGSVSSSTSLNFIVRLNLSCVPNCLSST